MSCESTEILEDYVSIFDIFACQNLRRMPQ